MDRNYSRPVPCDSPCLSHQLFHRTASGVIVYAISFCFRRSSSARVRWFVRRRCQTTAVKTSHASSLFRSTNRAAELPHVTHSSQQLPVRASKLSRNDTAPRRVPCAFLHTAPGLASGGESAVLIGPSYLYFAPSTVAPSIFLYRGYTGCVRCAGTDIFLNKQ